MQAGGADASSIECVPLIAAGAEPEVFLAGRPTAEGAPDSRAIGVEVFLLVGLAIQNHGLMREGAHAPLL